MNLLDRHRAGTRPGDGDLPPARSTVPQAPITEPGWETPARRRLPALIRGISMAGIADVAVQVSFVAGMALLFRDAYLGEGWSLVPLWLMLPMMVVVLASLRPAKEDVSRAAFRALSPGDADAVRPAAGPLTQEEIAAERERLDREVAFARAVAHPTVYADGLPTVLGSVPRGPRALRRNPPARIHPALRVAAALTSAISGGLGAYFAALGFKHLVLRGHLGGLAAIVFAVPLGWMAWYLFGVARSGTDPFGVKPDPWSPLGRALAAREEFERTYGKPLAPLHR